MGTATQGHTVAVYERVQQFRAHRAIQRQESSRLSERQPQRWHLEKFAPSRDSWHARRTACTCAPTSERSTSTVRWASREGRKGGANAGRHPSSNGRRAPNDLTRIAARRRQQTAAGFQPHRQSRVVFDQRKGDSVLASRARHREAVFSPSSFTVSPTFTSCSVTTPDRTSRTAQASALGE